MGPLKDRLLVRTILTHLIVSMPPALLLGTLIINAHRRGLVHEAQQVHLSAAGRLADRMTARLEASVASLEEAERILDATEVPFEQRKTMLRALVAAGQMATLAVYDGDGKRDTVVRGPAPATAFPEMLPAAVRSRARVERYALGTARAEGSARDWPLAIAWRRNDQVFGFLVTTLENGPFLDWAGDLGVNLLGTDGRMDVVDEALEPVLSTVDGDATVPFAALSANGHGPALEAIETGFAQSYDAGGTQYLGAIVSVPALGWLVAASRPEPTALASVGRVRTQVGLLAVGAALLAGLVALWLARHVTSPIVRLAHDVRRVAHDGFRGRVEAASGAEVGLLKDAFNEALWQLHRYRRSLRSTTQLRLKIARFLPPTALHEVLTTEFRVLQGGEKRPMTLVYVDVVSDASLVDAPKAHLVAMLCDVYESACGIVEDHGGRIDHFSGDSVIAIFAADDVADHPTAAVQASVSILDAVERVVARHGAPASVSVGVATGEGVIGRIENTEEVSVVGDLVESVVQLQHAAEGSTILLSSATAAQLSMASTDDPRIRVAESESSETNEGPES